MPTEENIRAGGAPLTQIWSGRCPVPTASGLALQLGWLGQEFAADGIAVGDSRDRPRDGAQGRTAGGLPHALPGLLREGGNIPALSARAGGERSRLIGLTWIDEGQALIVRSDSGIHEPRQLKGLRVALPAWSESLQGEPRRGSIARGMTLQGLHGALSFAGLGFDDIDFVEVGSGNSTDAQFGLQGLWAGLVALAEGKVDAVYVKGASALDASRRLGLSVGIDLDQLPDRRFRINNGTPRPLTVGEDFLAQHFDIVVRYLAQTLRAADWAAGNLAQVLAFYESETRGSADAVAATYRNGFERSLHPTLDDQRLGYFRRQKAALWRFGFLERDFDLDAWADHRPLEAARRLHAERTQAVAA